ncbi:MAG: crossover junction endodeoxyribonuclease RuvC [Dehalococcoidia bacterium]|nr:MAG: crossover junction endodeoxyribonuclease RuvC [Dehalococcoidia bacterium]UCG84009.1 MAG: crossover junction endodeoxyribonuclease RuvC [Dehalococcoidia bacterium]
MPTRVLGIDPGIALMGYGLVEDGKDRFTTIDYGCLSTSPKQATPERLLTLYNGITHLIEHHQPSEVAVELFIARNLKTALAVGQARGVAILAAATRGLPVFEYTPLEVKQNVSGYGRGGKEQIQEMVRIQLGLDCVPQPDDAADALAVAICHISKTRVSELLAHNQ